VCESWRRKNEEMAVEQVKMMEGGGGGGGFYDKWKSRNVEEWM
jgi:hypothetical protein